MEYNILYKQQSIDLPLGFHQWQASERTDGGWTNPFEKLRKSNWSKWTSNFLLWTFPKNIWVVTTGCQWQIHFWHLCWSFWAHLSTLCWELFLGRFLLIGRSIDSTFFWDIHWRKTSKLFKNPDDSCTMSFSNRFHAKKQHAFTKNLKKPAVANGDLGAKNQHQKSVQMWSLLTQVQHKIQQQLKDQRLI